MQTCRFCRILAVSIALMHSSESSTDKVPKKVTSHSAFSRWVCTTALLMSYKSATTQYKIIQITRNKTIKLYFQANTKFGTLTSVVLEGSLQKSRFFTKLSNVGAVVMREHVVAQNGVRHLSSRHQVHLQQTCLQRTFGRTVVFQGVQQKCSALLHHVLLHEDVHDLQELNGKIQQTLRPDSVQTLHEQ